MTYNVLYRGKGSVAHCKAIMKWLEENAPEKLGELIERKALPETANRAAEDALMSIMNEEVAPEGEYYGTPPGELQVFGFFTLPEGMSK